VNSLKRLDSNNTSIDHHNKIIENKRYSTRSYQNHAISHHGNRYNSCYHPARMNAHSKMQLESINMQKFNETMFKEERKVAKEERKLSKEERKLSKEERKTFNERETMSKEERKMSKEERKNKEKVPPGCDTSAKPNSRSENEEIPFVKPDEDLTKRIIDQVEFYFSDENIVKDAFLLKHVKRNKEGFVSLKLISSFKRVKHLSKDWRVVAFALAKSEKLQINEQGTKIRRVDPLPAYDQTTPSRTIVAINIPPESATIELVAEMFKPCGEIALIRLLRPGKYTKYGNTRHFSFG
ncbi:la-related protein 6, partial [Diaphorina citri]|uniref:La-related protein 6 n=1 Tax=Diaphorina citri TaxID=121845 RepID=A0A1S3DEE1_DIACI